MINQKIQDFLEHQKLGYVATVSSDGKPNVSPKGTIVGWNSEMLAFADIRSPDTMTNLKTNPHVEINVVDPILRKGYLFKGKCRIVSTGDMFEEILAYYRDKGIKSKINSIVLVDVLDVLEVTSPLYDMGISEQEVRSKWKKHFELS